MAGKPKLKCITIPEELVEKLIDRRHNLKLTQAILSKRINISPSYMSSLEMDPYVNPTLNTFLNWLQSLRIEGTIEIEGVVLYDYRENSDL